MQEADEGETEVSSEGSPEKDITKSAFPTMIFCNPNAGFAEIFQYQSDWLDFYVNMGINVFVWNYRGFGLSEGDPTPKVCLL